jgi:hypothetical protein
MGTPRRPTSQEATVCWETLRVTADSVNVAASDNGAAQVTTGADAGQGHKPATDIGSQHSGDNQNDSGQWPQADFERENKRELVQEVVSGVIEEAASPVTGIIDSVRAAGDGDYLGAGVGLAGAGCDALKLCKAAGNLLGAAWEPLKRLIRRKGVPKGTPKQGIYEFPDQAAGGVPYVGQSGSIPSRLSQHEAAGRLVRGTETTTEVLGGRTSREVAEHLRLQELTNGVPARHSPNVSNKVDPIGLARQHLLD